MAWYPLFAQIRLIVLILASIYFSSMGRSAGISACRLGPPWEKGDFYNLQKNDKNLGGNLFFNPHINMRSHHNYTLCWWLGLVAVVGSHAGTHSGGQEGRICAASRRAKRKKHLLTPVLKMLLKWPGQAVIAMPLRPAAQWCWSLWSTGCCWPRRYSPSLGQLHRALAVSLWLRCPWQSPRRPSCCCSSCWCTWEGRVVCPGFLSQCPGCLDSISHRRGTGEKRRTGQPCMKKQLACGPSTLIAINLPTNQLQVVFLPPLPPPGSTWWQISFAS